MRIIVLIKKDKNLESKVKISVLHAANLLILRTSIKALSQLANHEIPLKPAP